MQIKIHESGVTIHAYASNGMIYVEQLKLEWQHQLGPCELKIKGSLAITEARTYLTKRIADQDPDSSVEELRQSAIARALVLLDWLESTPQSTPATSARHHKHIAHS
jgi:hypothetical protein